MKYVMIFVCVTGALLCGCRNLSYGPGYSRPYTTQYNYPQRAQLQVVPNTNWQERLAEQEYYENQRREQERMQKTWRRNTFENIQEYQQALRGHLYNPQAIYPQ